jgi:FkbM family methyltransferase
MSLVQAAKGLAVKALCHVSMYEPLRSCYLKTCRPADWKEQIDAIKFYSLFVSEDSLVFDVGANRGKHTRYFLALGASVIAVEPIPRCAKNLRRMYLKRRVTVVPSAVGDRPSTAMLHISSYAPLSTLSDEWLQTAQSSPRFRDMSWNETVEVSVTTLDSLIERYGIPDFIKIDVEGFESKVLDGLSEMPRALCFEFNTEYLEATIECLRKTCFPDTARFNYITGEPAGEPLLPQWVSADEMISIMKKSFQAAHVQGDVLVCRN